MNLHILHDITFYALYAALALAVFVAIERMIFFSTTSRRTEELEDAVEHGAVPPANLVDADNVPAGGTKHMLPRMPSIKSRHDLEDLSEEVFIDARTAFRKRLWLFDTIVTASPLLRLLGTILGIVDPFMALARSGISDPSGVSAGIGTALFATALGISVVLFGLLFFNSFPERIDRLSDQMKVLILRLSALKPMA
ncbi:MAG: MotA/TolQ/ExbB proton channel family protein [Burkholderiaceae bacterium]